MGDIICQRVYTKPLHSGCHILTDRLWPRGVKKDSIALDLWSKNVAPTTELRKWFDHSESRFEKFTELYLKELDENPLSCEFAFYCKEKLKDTDVVLLYAAKDEKINHAVVLRAWLVDKLKIN